MNTKPNLNSSRAGLLLTAFFLLTLLLTGCTDTLVSYEDAPLNDVLTEEAAWEVQEGQAMIATPNSGRMMETDRLVKRHNHRADAHQLDLEGPRQALNPNAKPGLIAPMQVSGMVQRY